MARDLAQRTNAAVAQQNDDSPPTVAQLLTQMRPEIEKALPAHLKGERFARMALTTLRNTPALQRCNAMSFVAALMTCAQLGLEPGPLGEAWFVPYGNKVTFIPGYRGLIKLAHQSGQLRNIAAHVVRENDTFEFRYGLDPKLDHVPYLDGPRGNVRCVYAAATFVSGGNAFVVMSLDDVEAIRAQSPSARKNDSPWMKHWDAMARKTAIRQLIRYMPLSTEMQRMALAAQLDGSVRSDLRSDLDDAAVSYIAGETVQTEAGAVDPTSGEVVGEVILEDQPPAEDPPGWGPEDA